MNRSPWPGGEILRDVTRGGLAGLIVGLVVAGLGGRLVMRLAALAVPSANGAFTENGNRIGDITVVGSVGLIVAVGLIGAIFLATVWVAISPWLPGKGIARGLVAMPIAIALGAFGIINAGNPDFFVLGHSPVVVAILLALIALTAPAMAVTDGWLDRRLPHAASSTSVAGAFYIVLSLLGFVLGSVVVLQSIADPEAKPLGVTVLAVGIVTIAWWGEFLRGAAAPSRVVRNAGRTILVVGTCAGYLVLAPEIAGALDLG